MPETEAGTTIIQFGHCQLFTNRRELFVDGVPVPLGSRAFDVLQMLVDAGGDLVTKDEILSRIWPGIVVEENTLQVQITRVRRALGRDRGFLKQLFSAGLDCAHRQGALSWVLRCATSLSRLWRNENRIQEAHLVLAPILARFGEGFATADLMTARALLDKLQETNPAEPCDIQTLPAAGAVGETPWRDNTTS